jgi:hypothetical protein
MLIVMVANTVLSAESCTSMGKWTVPGWVGVPVRTLLRSGGITVDRLGSYTVKITYINPDATDRYGYLSVNGGTAIMLSFPTHRRQQLQQRRRRSGAARSGRRWQHADLHQPERTGPHLDKI